MSVSVTKLIQVARSGDRVALERLLIDHAEQLRIHLLRGLPTRVKGTISVEDVVQETLTRAFLKIDRLQGDSPRAFAAWLLAIGDMTLIDLVRKETAQARGGRFLRQELTRDSATGSMVALLEQLPGEEATASRIAASQEGIAALQVAIAGLPNDQRHAVQLHLLQGMTLQETSDALGRSTAAVRSLVHRAKENLAQAMGRASLWLSRK
jgi:RNA polymerase sigma-70 factor (ECF subfamily)